MNSANNRTGRPERMETKHVAMWMDGELLCARYADNLFMTLDVAKACVEARIFFSAGESYPLLIDMTGIKSITTDARAYMASVGAIYVKAGALITRSAISRTIGNIFLKIDRPPVPVKLFTSEKKARMWLKQFVAEPVAVNA